MFGHTICFGQFSVSHIILVHRHNDASTMKRLSNNLHVRRMICQQGFCFEVVAQIQRLKKNQ